MADFWAATGLAVSFLIGVAIGLIAMIVVACGHIGSRDDDEEEKENEAHEERAENM